MIRFSGNWASFLPFAGSIVLTKVKNFLSKIWPYVQSWLSFWGGQCEGEWRLKSFWLQIAWQTSHFFHWEMHLERVVAINLKCNGFKCNIFKYLSLRKYKGRYEITNEDTKSKFNQWTHPGQYILLTLLLFVIRKRMILNQFTYLVQLPVRRGQSGFQYTKLMK